MLAPRKKLEIYKAAVR